jgi:hypothetical protein
MSNKNAHRYRVTLVRVGGESAATDDAVPLVFTHENHDDLAHIIERARLASGLDADSSAAMAVGLKLLTGVMLEQRNNPLFDVLRGPVREFIGNLKARSAEASGR